MNKNKTVFLSVMGIATLLVAIVGATFAYFSTQITGDQTTTRGSITTGALAQVVFTGWNTAISIEDALPGKVIANNETFTVAAAGNISGTTIPYSCTVTRTADSGFPSFEYKFSTTSNGGTWTTAATSTLNGTLETNNEVDTYYISVRFKETGQQQNNTSGAANTTNEAGKSGNISVSCGLTGGTTLYYNNENPTGTATAPLDQDTIPGTYTISYESGSSTYIGQPIPQDVDILDTLDEVADAWEEAYGQIQPMWFRHEIGSYSGYCPYNDWEGLYTCRSGGLTLSQCNSLNKGECSLIEESDVITETYLVFTVTDDDLTAARLNYLEIICENVDNGECMAEYVGGTAGTYSIKGGDNGVSYSDNIATLNQAFGTSNCEERDNFSYYSYSCSLDGELENRVIDNVNVEDSGYVNIQANGHMWCNISDDGISTCGNG